MLLYLDVYFYYQLLSIFCSDTLTSVGGLHPSKNVQKIYSFAEDFCQFVEDIQYLLSSK